MDRKQLAAVAGLLSFAAAAVAAPTPAHAVPGWATTSVNLGLPVHNCRMTASTAVKTATGAAPGSPSQTYSSMGSLTAGYVPATGVFVYCIAHPTTICGQPSSTAAIVAFSDAGSGQAALLRDKVRTAIGNPILIDCNR